MKPKRKKPLTVRQVALKHGFRSGLEDKIADNLVALGVPFEYEKLVIGYTQPEKKRTYTPDFLLLSNGIIIESKCKQQSIEFKCKSKCKQRSDSNIISNSANAIKTSSFK